MAAIVIFKYIPPPPLRSFDTHARWQPVTQIARSRQSYGKIEDCEQSTVLKTKHSETETAATEQNAYRMYVVVTNEI